MKDTVKLQQTEEVVILKMKDEKVHLRINEENFIVKVSGQGPSGAPGATPVSCYKVSSAGLVDTYCILMSDGTQNFFTVTNGRPGPGIASIEKTGTEGLVDTYTIYYEDEITPPSTFTVTNGAKGERGQDGGGSAAVIEEEELVVFTPEVGPVTPDLPGLMTPEDKEKLDGIEANANNYTLPTASATVKGGIKVGANLVINNDVLSATATAYTQGEGISIANGAISNAGVRSIQTGTTDGTISVNTGGNTSEVSVAGLGSAAFTDSSEYADSAHTHDDRYYTETEVDNALALKSNKTQDVHHTYFVRGTQTAKTGAWTGVLSDVDALYEGLTIDYWLPFDGSGNATLNLTLKDGTTTGAVNCYHSGTTRLTTHIPANSMCRLIYQTVLINAVSYTGWWCLRAYDSNSNDNARYFQYYNRQKAKSAITNNRICVGSASGMEHLTYGVTFDINYPIEYVTAAVSVNAENYANIYDRYYDINLISALGLTASDFTGVAGHMVYLVGTLSGKDFTTDSTTLITCTEPTTEDGKLYMLLGKLGTDFTSSAQNRFILQEKHPIFAYKDGAFQPIDYLDTKYSITTDTIGSASTGTAIKADDITAWNAGSTPTLGTAISADDITAWDAGSVPTLGTAISADDITKWEAGTVPTLGTAISADDITDWDAGTTPTLGTAIPADDITAWDAGSTPTLGTAIPADDITDWDAGSTPTLGTAISADDITAWNAGSTPTLGTAIPADDITAWSAGTLPTAVVEGENLTLTFGTLPSLSYTAKSIPNVTNVGSVPTLSYTARTIPNVTDVGSVPTLAYTPKSIPNVTSVGTKPSLSYTAKSIPNVTSVGTAPSLSYTARSIPNVTSVGTAPKLEYTARTIPNVTDVGEAPTLSYTARSIPNVTNVGSVPSLSYTEKTIPNITVTQKTVVTDITAS